MGFWDAICGALGTAVAVVLTPILIANPWLIPIVAAVALLAGVLSKGTEKEVEELGDKALQCDKKQDDFDSFEDYFEYVKNFEVDREKSKETTAEEKRVTGAVLSIQGIEEKNGIKVGEFLKTVVDNKDHFTPDKINNYIKTFSEAGVDLEKVYANETGKIEKQSEKDQIDNLVKKAENL